MQEKPWEENSQRALDGLFARSDLPPKDDDYRARTCMLDVAVEMAVVKAAKTKRAGLIEGPRFLFPGTAIVLPSRAIAIYASKRVMMGYSFTFSTSSMALKRALTVRSMSAKLVPLMRRTMLVPSVQSQVTTWSLK